MTTIIKSNTKSNKNIGNIFGVAGALDYSLLLDFNLSEYHKKTNGVVTPISMSNAISFSRASKATYITPTSSLMVAEVNEPRISFDDRTGKQGLLLESRRNEYLLNTQTPATHTISTTIDANSKLVLSVKGSGSASITGSALTLASGSPSVATEGSPAAYDRTGTGNSTVTVIGNLEAFSLQSGTLTLGQNAKSITPSGLTRVEEDICSLNSALFTEVLSNKSAYTILVKVVENRLPFLNGAGGTLNVFALVDTTKTKEGIYVYRTTGNAGRLRANFTKTSGSVSKSVNVVVQDSVISHNHVLSCDSNGQNAIVGRNGEVTVVDGEYNLTPNKLFIGSDNGYTAASGLNGIVTQVVIYPYKMTVAQIQELSKL